MKVQWFAMEVDEQTCPWAWQSGNPQHKIGSLELFANLFLPRMVSSHANGQHLCWRIRCHTDNQSNAYGLHRWSIKGEPQYSLLMEMAMLAMSTQH
eukprot:3754199-Amphidinium_carterae.1